MLYLQIYLMKLCIIKNDLKFQQQSMENSKRNQKKQQSLTQSRRALSRKVSIHNKSFNELGQHKPNTVKSDLKNNRLDDNKKSSVRVSNNDRKQDKSATKQNISLIKTMGMTNKDNRKSSLQKLSFFAPHIGKSLKLLLATLLDISTIQSHLKQIASFSTSLSSISPSSIPSLYGLILEYEQQFSRAYTEEIRYYIIGTLWDQGYVKIGKGDEWQLHIEQQYKGQRKQKVGIYERSKLNTQIVLLIQCIEEQYHRQQITLSKLIECLSKQSNLSLCDNTYKRRMQNYSYRYKGIQQLLYKLFDAFDHNKLGSLGLVGFIEQFYIQQQPQTVKVLSNCIINKVCNNVHNFDKNTNSISNPFKHSNNKNVKQVNECRIHIENILQLINRIYTHQPNLSHHTQVSMSEHVCCTYNSIAYILSKYEQMKGLVYQQLQSDEKQQINTTNDGIIIRAEMDNIRRAATTIVKCRKAHLANNLITQHLQYQDYLMNQLHAANSHELYLNSKLETLYQTNKNQPHMVDDEQLTFRHKTQQMRMDEIEKEIPNITLSTGSESKILKNTSKARDTASTATAPMHRQMKDNSIYSIQNSVKTRDRIKQETNDKKLQIRIQDQMVNTALAFNQKIYTPKQTKNNNNPQIRHFTVQKQPISMYSVSANEEKIDPFNFHIKSNYDQLLRSRIENELRIVELQKLKNRMKYYQIMYQ